MVCRPNLSANLMSTLLMSLQPFAKIYADLLSDILKLVVSIVDEEMNRVAGSNRYMSSEIRRQINVAHESGIMQRAFQEKQIQVVDRPRLDPICQDCSSREACCERFNISAPIVVDQKVYGGIAIIAMTERQQKRALRNKMLYLSFIQQFSNLLALKIRSEQEKRQDDSVLELMKSIIDRVDLGVVAFRPTGEVALVNAVARNILQIRTLPLPVQCRMEPSGGSETSPEYALTIAQTTYHLHGTLHRVGLREYSDIFIFQPAQTSDVPEPAASTSPRTEGVERIVGYSSKITAFKEQLLQCARTSSNVLIYGENGTELYDAARAIHEESTRCTRQLHTYRCIQTDEARINRQLFGAAAPQGGRGTPGLLELAAKGTLYLEDIDKLPLESQSAILRALQQGHFRRTGGNRDIRLDLRLVVSAEQDLRELSQQGRFLKSLYFLLSVVTLYMPPLREREDDVIILAQRMLSTKQKDTWGGGITPGFWQAMRQYAWPGNVLELQGKMHYVCDLLAAGEQVSGDTLWFKKEEENQQADSDTFCLRKLERSTIRRALLQFGPTTQGRRAAAQALGISLSTLYRKIQEYELEQLS